MIEVSNLEKRQILRRKFRKLLTVNFDQNEIENDCMQLPMPKNKGICVERILTLDLSNNKIDFFPEYLFSLNNLKYLKLENTDISSLPSNICNLMTLKYLNASRNGIQSLPENLGNLENLEILNVSFNSLSKLPTSCTTLNRLKKLFISNNRFESFPECIEEGMKNLETLDLSQNPLKFLSPTASSRLEIFSASSLECCKFFPKWILHSGFWRIKELNLNETSFSRFFIRENSITHLTIFSMKMASLNDTNLEKILSCMVEVEKIDVSNDALLWSKNFNTFCYFPGLNLRSPGLVREINVKRTGIPFIPHSIDRFLNLKKLNIGGNKINWLPDEICNIINLEILIVDRCSLSNLPQEFGNLKNLKEFIACHNRLLELPESVDDLENLRILDLFNNEFYGMPRYLPKGKLRGLDLEMNYFEVDDRMIGDILYSLLRDDLRKYCNYQRSSGSKPVMKELFYDCLVSKSSENLSENEEEIVVNPNNYIPEDWGRSEDSSDEYEPAREPKLKFSVHRSLKYFHLKYSCYFVPSDFHSRKVHDVIRQIKRKGLSSDTTPTIVDGQFDDAL